MKTHIEQPDPLHRTISVELPWDMVSEELDREYGKLAKKVQLKGFRKGKVPRNVLRQRFGKQVRADVQSRLIQEAYEAVLIQNGIQPVAQPELDTGALREGEPYTFSAKVEVQPTVELQQIAGFDVDVERAEPDEKMIAEEIERLREARAVLVPIERDEARKGDVAILSYRASRDGVMLEGGEKEHHEVELGSGSTVVGFDDQIIGMRVGQSKEFDLDFPAENVPESVAGKTIHFEVELEALKQRELPEFDDDFAKDLGEDGVETADDARAMVERRLREGLSSKAERDAKTKLIDQLIAANPFPVPPALVERQKAAMFQELQGVLRMQGVPPDKIQEYSQKMFADLEPRAEREVASSLLLDAVADEKGISIAAADLARHLEQVAAKSGQNLSQLKALYADESRKRELEISLRREKVVEHLMELSKMRPSAGDGQPDASTPETDTDGSNPPAGDSQ
jgi:trigger factor